MTNVTRKQYHDFEEGYNKILPEVLSGGIQYTPTSKGVHIKVTIPSGVEIMSNIVPSSIYIERSLSNKIYLKNAGNNYYLYWDGDNSIWANSTTNKTEWVLETVSGREDCYYIKDSSSGMYLYYASVGSDVTVTLSSTPGEWYFGERNGRRVVLPWKYYGEEVKSTMYGLRYSSASSMALYSATYDNYCLWDVEYSEVEMLPPISHWREKVGGLINESATDLLYILNFPEGTSNRDLVLMSSTKIDSTWKGVQKDELGLPYLTYDESWDGSIDKTKTGVDGVTRGVYIEDAFDIDHIKIDESSHGSNGSKALMSLAADIAEVKMQPRMIVSGWGEAEEECSDGEIIKYLTKVSGIECTSTPMEVTLVDEVLDDGTIVYGDSIEYKIMSLPKDSQNNNIFNSTSAPLKQMTLDEFNTAFNKTATQEEMDSYMDDLMSEVSSILGVSKSIPLGKMTEVVSVIGEGMTDTEAMMDGRTSMAGYPVEGGSDVVWATVPYAQLMSMAETEFKGTKVLTALLVALGMPSGMAKSECQLLSGGSLKVMTLNDGVLSSDTALQYGSDSLLACKAGSTQRPWIDCGIDGGSMLLWVDNQCVFSLLAAMAKKRMDSLCGLALVGVGENGGVMSWMVKAADTYNISVSTIVQAFTMNPNAQKRCIYMTSEKWGNSETANPDTTNYYGLYESKTRNTASVSDILTIHTCGKAGTLKVLVTSWAEGGYDYCIVGNLDASVDSGTKIDTKSNNKDSTSVNNFLVAEFDIPDTNDHYFQIKYRTDGSTNRNDDRAYLLIPKTEGVVVSNFS